MSFEDRAMKILQDLADAKKLADKLEEKMFEFETKLLIAEIYEEIG